jgi:hypothetical protein
MIRRVIFLFGVYEQQAWPKKAELQVHTLRQPYHYTSSPEDGMPALPFRNNAKRKSADEPWFWSTE